jgi:murein DD-endopeptidase MepM/ murein hydrolase activator NlpD
MTDRRIFRIMIVPEGSARVRRLQLSYQNAKLIALGACLVVAVAAVGLVNYVFVLREASEYTALKAQHTGLQTQLRVVEDELARVDATLQRIDQFAEKVRRITRVHDPERSIALGPLSPRADATAKVMYASGERIEYEDELPDSQLAVRLLESKVDSVRGHSLEQERNMQELHALFIHDAARQSGTPSIRPVNSKLVNSRFGVRTDPETGREVMHKGVDFAADHGSPVTAPGDGMVVFAASHGEYGKVVVLDHGFGLQTHFAHLSEFSVDVGDTVQRGDRIGAVGNTGRTTGVHLHYEVRLHGIPQDPEHYLLD